jgi:cobalt-zinc-cadmium efflux system membrane fusion protein
MIVRQWLWMCLAVTAVLLTACSKDPASPAGAEMARAAPAVSEEANAVLLSEAEQRANQISTEVAELRQEPEFLRVPGRITLSDSGTWRVGTLVEGRAEQVLVGIGDYVKKSQVLALVNSNHIHDARALYVTSVTELNRLQSATQLAQRSYERMQRLYALKAASLEQTEVARQELTNAQAALHNGEIAVARDRQHLEEHLGVPADIPAGGILEELNLMPIRAPADGYILMKNVTPGTVVQPSVDLFVIGELGRLWMVASMRQELLGKLKVGQRSTIGVSAYPDRRFEGTITNLGQQIDPVTRLLNVRIDLDNPEGLLRPEMLANAEIPIGEPKPVILVAADSIQQVNQQNVVFVKTAPDRFELRPVATGEPVSGRARVLSGLSGGEQVVTHGSFVLKSQLLKATLQGQ